MRIISWVLVLLAVSSPAVAQPQSLRWGMDETGGAPYVFDNQTKGFEVEIAAYLAKKLGRVSTPVNGEWNKLPEMLERGDLDLVLNGYEYSEQYHNQASIRYYIYRLALTLPAQDTRIQSWEDLRAKPGQSKIRVGVLTGSAAQRYLEQTFGDSISLQQYDDVANTFALVATGGLDATVQDTPAAGFYLAEDRKTGRHQLRTLPETRAEGSYVILTKKDDHEFREAINQALRDGIEDGTFQAIYQKYGIWNKDQERLNFGRKKSWDELNTLYAASGTQAEADTIAAPAINWGTALGLLVQAAGLTVFLAVIAMPLATILGMAVATLRLYGPGWLARFLTLYVEVLRGTPFLLQLWVLYYLLPSLIPAFRGIPKELIGILGLALNYSASQAEHFRGAFQNLPRGQVEAALALGMTMRTTVRRILAPQAFRAAVPSMTNDFVAMFKDTAVCSVIAVMELTKQYNTLYNNHRSEVLGLAALTGLLYLMMSYPLALLSRRLEHRMNRST